jgi:hypothetical protein
MIAKERKNRKMLNDLAIYIFFFYFSSFFPLLEDVGRKLGVQLQIEVKPQGQQNGKKEHFFIIGLQEKINRRNCFRL